MGLFNIFSKPSTPKVVKNPFADDYYSGIEKIECMWAVLKNLDLLNSKDADTFEKLCTTNKKGYLNMIGFDKNHNKQFAPPPYAPCYVRLAMLYEKRKEWDKAINICIEAIKYGAYDDHSKGKMYGRLARMIKKAGIKPTKEMTQYISMKG